MCFKFKVILIRLNQQLNDMNFIKKIARKILSEELNTLQEQYEYKISRLEIKNKGLLDSIFGKRKILLSQDMVDGIVKTLPDPNKFGNGNINSSELNNQPLCFVDELRGIKCKHIFKIVKVIEGKDKKIQGITINISDYNINVFIPLKREKVEYNVFNVNSEIDTYFWDFYQSGIRMINNEAWLMSIEFITAQNNVINELKEEGLL